MSSFWRGVNPGLLQAFERNEEGIGCMQTAGEPHGQQKFGQPANAG